MIYSHIETFIAEMAFEGHDCRVTITQNDAGMFRVSMIDANDESVTYCDREGNKFFTVTASDIVTALTQLDARCAV